jgi:hypothetical protein
VQQSVTMFPVLISITNEEGLLLPGMNGEVSMQVDHREDVLAVPLDAVRTVRELPSVAATLGLNADSVRVQVARFAAARRTRPAGMSAGADSTHRRFAGAGSDSTHRRSAGGWGGRWSGAAGGGGMGIRGPGAGAGFSTTDVGSGTRADRAQAVLVKTAKGIEPRLVRIGLSDFDYGQVLNGLEEGDQVVLLGVVEQQAKRTDQQTQIRERMGTGMPGSAPGGGGRPAGGGR